jgi:hypothetical protein
MTTDFNYPIYRFYHSCTPAAMVIHQSPTIALRSDRYSVLNSVTATKKRALFLPLNTLFSSVQYLGAVKKDASQVTELLVKALTFSFSKISVVEDHKRFTFQPELSVKTLVRMKLINLLNYQIYPFTYCGNRAP